VGQRTAILAEILGFRGWRVFERFYESGTGQRIEVRRATPAPAGVRLVLRMERRWAPRTACCGGRRMIAQGQRDRRRWADLPWAGHPVDLEYAPLRVECRRCNERAVELLAWADPYQRQTRRLQQQMAFESASMPVEHVAVLHGLNWSTVRRAELAALLRWERTRVPPPLRHVGVDEKHLGRRGKRPEPFVTIVSNLETNEPVWIGWGRRQETLQQWLAPLKPEEKASIVLFVMDMHRPFLNAVRADPQLAHAVVVHDPFHVMKRVGDALDELRREVFFRAGPESRRLGRGKRWLYLRRWEKCSEDQQAELRDFLRLNRTLARGYQIAEEIRAALHAPDREAMGLALTHILLRTQRRDCVALRKLHDSLQKHWPELLGLADHRPATGRVEALNNNWETLVRRARGYRDLDYLLHKLRFSAANPIRTEHGVARFLALDIPAPFRPKT